MRVPVSVEKNVTTTRVEKFDLQLDTKLLHQLLRNAGVDVPANARVYFAVPGGGDWSNTDIDIDAGHPIYVSWEKVEESDA